MKQIKLNIIILFFSFTALSNPVNASLASNSILLMGSQSSHCFNDLGMPGACTSYEIPDSNCFAVDGMNAHIINTYKFEDGVFSEEERVGFEVGIDGGMILGTLQDVGYIDSSWGFNGGTGNHYTRSPITIISDDNTGNVILDMSGFTVWWEN